jgi:hypothetical protein
MPSYKGGYNKNENRAKDDFVLFLYCHASGWPKYRPKNVYYMNRPLLRPFSGLSTEKSYKGR